MARILGTLPTSTEPQPTGGRVLGTISPGNAQTQDASAQPQPSQPTTLGEKYGSQEAGPQFAEGFAKGGLSTLSNTFDIVRPALKYANIPGIINTAITGKPLPEIPNPFEGADLKPKGTAQNVGFGTEKVAEFVAPSGALNKAESAINTAIKGTDLISKATRVLGKAGAEGLYAGGITYAQTGDKEQAKNAAITAGALKGLTGAVGETVKGLKIPERLYSTIFKNSYDDMLSELKSIGTSDLQARNPARFKELVESGIIKVGPDKSIVVNETLAKQALDRGLKGSLVDMSNATVHGLYDSEDAVRKIASAATERVPVKEEQFKKVLLSIGQEYKEVGFGEFAQKAEDLAAAIDQNGTISAPQALEARRLLDGLRVRSSFGQQPPKLSLGQENLKFLADTLRSRLAKIPGMADTMKNYSFHIDALEALAKEAARRGNNQVISLIDSVLLGGDVMASAPVGGGLLFAGKKALTTPRLMTNIAQGIKNSGTISTLGSIGKGLINTAVSEQ